MSSGNPPLPSQRQTGKERGSRISLDYFRKPDPLERRKHRTAWLALLVSGLCVGGILWGILANGSPVGRQLASRGPLAAPHATWEQQCDACHAPFAPTSGESSWASGLLFFGTSHTSDKKCNACHLGDQAAAHHANIKEGDAGTCASCHIDHKGRDASLVRTEDAQCTRCHSDLQQHHQGTGALAFAANVTAFNEEHHPEFRLIKDKAKDPGKLKFDHSLHMQVGLGRSPAEQNWQAFTLAEIADPAQRERYRADMKRRGIAADGDDVAVALDCSSCHVQDSTNFNAVALAGVPASTIGPRGGNGYMQPIVYDIQCAACHRLGFDPAAPELTIPHRLQPAQVRQFLWGAYAAREADKAGLTKPAAEPGAAEEATDAPTRTFPGKDLARVAGEAQAAVESQTDEAEKFLFTKMLTQADKLIYRGKRICGECHHYEDGENPTQAPLRIIPPQVNQVWFQHARFDHSAHRAVNCRECHEKAYPDARSPSIDAGDVLLPGIATCVKCHAPASHSGSEPRGGARFDCAECHRYHNGDAPLQGLGAFARDAGHKADLMKFLSGTMEAPASAAPPAPAQNPTPSTTP